jgi:UPF0716 protein FxsA
MGKLLLLFILVPAVELAILIEIGTRLGTLPTVALILSTGILGAFLARRQGTSVLRAARAQMERGELPAGSLADGVLILVAGAFLITPGVVTDTAGFLLLIPGIRDRIKASLLRRVRRAVEERRIQVRVAGFGAPGGGPVYDWRGEPFDSDPMDPTGGSHDATKYRIH